MRVDALDYDLPPELVAQVPAARREDARLLVLDRRTGAVEDRLVTDLPVLLAPGDRLVLNDTRVIPARLAARRATGGRVDLLLLPPEAPGATWTALVRAGGSLQPGEPLAVAPGEEVALGAALGAGRWEVASPAGDLAGLLRRHGRMPLPPYIRRGEDDPRDALDRERYQTAYAREDGAVAAPTAGLHLTPRLLEALAAGGVGASPLTLRVGLGTFAPVRTERLEDHAMHVETYDVPGSTVEALRATRAAGGRVVAVGTTTVRALEAAARGTPEGLPRPGPGRTDLLIAPGHRFLVVDALLTNFHLPRSTLLALVAAFAGLDAVLAAYREAVGRRYRFHSYGDAMLIR